MDTSSKIYPTKIVANFNTILVGGFNPFEKYESNWIISPSRVENKKIFELPPARIYSLQFFFVFLGAASSGCKLRARKNRFPKNEMRRLR